MTNSTLMPTFNRILAFDRELDRLVKWNGKRFFVPRSTSWSARTPI